MTGHRIGVGSAIFELAPNREINLIRAFFIPIMAILINAIYDQMKK